MVNRKESMVDKGLNKWNEWNKFTLVMETGMVVAGLGLAVPWLIALGATGIVVDATQIHLINRTKEWRMRRQNHKETVMNQGKDYKLQPAM